MQKCGKRFVIGANLGPVYSEQYWDRIKTLFSKYTHVCLRDYSSYYMVRELSHVQYAPDVIFLTEYTPLTFDNEEYIVISVINVCQYTTDQEVVSAYYNLLEKVILYFSEKK